MLSMMFSLPVGDSGWSIRRVIVRMGVLVREANDGRLVSGLVNVFR